LREAPIYHQPLDDWADLFSGESAAQALAA